MKKICAVSKKEFEVTPEDLAFYEKMGVPAPTLCPEERERRRLAWRNEKTLYKRKCDATGKILISIHHPDAIFPVYENQYWWSDAWDPLKYGRDFDFSRPFFDQFFEMMREVPQLAIMNDNGVRSENCQYCQDFSRGKNCYLVTGSWYIQDSAYCNNCNRGKDIFDSSSINIDCELVYESVLCQRVYHCIFLQQSENCSDCFFGLDLKGCSHCFGCVGLRQKQYYFFNEPCTKEEYESKMKEINLGSHQVFETYKKKFLEFKSNFPRCFAHLKNCENCTGDDLYHCKNVQGFDTFNGENSKFVDRLDGPLWCYDLMQTGTPQWCLDCITPDKSWMTMFSIWCWKTKNVAYSDNCHSCEDLLGCIGLKHKKYCIFNKQYSREEYFALREKIVEHMKKEGVWGEFFPLEASPFGYNETQANEYYPLTREEVLSRGLRWRDTEEGAKYDGPKYEIPDSIDDISDDICNKILTCDATEKYYRITKQELDFYQKVHLPIPRLCPDERHRRRMALRNPKKLWSRKCDKCGAGIETTFAPDRPEKVYCEKCYLESVN